MRRYSLTNINGLFSFWLTETNNSRNHVEQCNLIIKEGLSGARRRNREIKLRTKLMKSQAPADKVIHLRFFLREIENALHKQSVVL